ncbi:sodium/calcium exchanger regulatory protein 1-like [Mercenaria mercenaria]|uniref:sodium/calcium exchanger regulatory protein 1-like n=1 Tax=Mercenaria mercenaria TaxID=6596 RepID=UPI00234E81C1|nr:sodium/calcium exchanger regulatory protein 1-like [Mercenaria mercenaria]
MSLEGFDESLGGKWILVRNEGFDEYLSAMGVGYIKRKIAGAVTTKMEMIKVNDKRIRIVTKGPKDMDTQINIDEEIDEVDPFDNKIKVKVTWDPAAKLLRTESNPAEGSAAKTSIVERKIVENGEMLMEVTLPNEKIVCKRYFKKEES